MSSVTKPGRAVAKYIPTPEQIAASCAEIDCRRLAAFDAAKAETRKSSRERALQRRRLSMEKARLRLIEAANAELQEQESEADVDPRDPRQVEQWIPVPSVDDDRREASAVRHRREFYTRFFPEWSQITTLDETLARDESKEWREEKQRQGQPAEPAVPTWTIEASFGDRTARERIDDEIRALSLFRIDPMHPAFIALQRRVLARYLWGIRREGRRVPKTPNWGYKLANQLMLERDETEPLDLFDFDPETVARVTHGVPRTRRDVIPYHSKRR